MAFTGGAVWEVQTGGDDTNNGGGFDTGASGFPTDGAATLATSASPVFTSASYTFVAGDVGAWLYIKSGTNWTPGFYLISSVSAGAATLSAGVAAAVLAGGGQTSPYAQNSLAGCATTASPTAATWGVDYSQNATSRLTFTDLVIAATTTNFTSTANPVGKNFIGNTISVTSGTGFTVQRVAVVSTSGTTATCDKSLGTAASTGGNGRLGGCLASPGMAGSLVVANNKIFIKSGTYTITSATANVSGGCVSLVASSGGSEGLVSGYSSMRFDYGTRPLLQASGISTFTIVNANTFSRIENINVDGANLTGSKGIASGNVNSRAYKCKASNCKNGGIVTQMAILCEATGCSGVAAVGAPFAIGCWSHDNTIHGFQPSGTFAAVVSYSSCLATNNTGATTDGFSTSSQQGYVNLCTSYGSGRDGFRFLNNAMSAYNCLSVNNSGYGFNNTSNPLDGIYLFNSATYNNTSGALGGLASATFLLQGGIVSLTGSPFTNAASNDFTLNNTAGGGASCRAAGIPGAIAGLTQVGSLDIGAFQHADPASGVSLSRVFTGF